jgi:hypothetical protein
MSIVRVMRFSVVAVLAVACASDGALSPPKGFNHSAVTFACGPADGPAVAIYLAPDPITLLEPTGTFVRVYVPRSLDQVLNRMWPINGVNSEAAAWFQSTALNAELATGGYLIVGRLGPDSTITGTVSLNFRNAGHVGGGFHAVWIPPRNLCG